MVKLADVARAAGVGYGTASRAISGRGSVDAETRDRVLEAARAMGYRRDAAARALRERRSHTIGLVIPDIVNEFYTESAEVLQSQLALAGLHLMVATTGNDAATEREAIETMMERQVDGLVLVPVDPTAPLPDDVPVVQLNRSSDSSRTAVLSDDRAGVAELVRHVLDQGYRDIAVVSGPSGPSTTRERLAGVHDAVDDVGGLRVREVEAAFTAAAGADAFARLASDPPQAVIALSSRITLGVLREAHRRAIAIPESMALAAYGDPEWFSVWGGGITTYAPPLAEMGRRAAEALIAELGGEPSRTIEPLRGTVHVRATTPPRL